MLVPSLGIPQPRLGNLLPFYANYPSVLTSIFSSSSLFLPLSKTSRGQQRDMERPCSNTRSATTCLQEWAWLRASSSAPSGWLRGASSARDINMGQCGEGPGNSTDFEVCQKNSRGLWHPEGDLKENFVKRGTFPVKEARGRTS